MRNRLGSPSRRGFLRVMGYGAAALVISEAIPRARAAGAAKPLRGLFPIGFTPFTADDKIDLDGLASQVRFCNRGRVHGFMWPQNASGWTNLSEKERLDGAEAILSAGKGGKTALVIGVQGPDLETVARYARQAEKLGADAIVSLPPQGVSDEKALLEYFQQVGRITSLPLFAQAVAPMNVDLLLNMFKTIPTFRYLKDEAGDPLEDITELREKTGGQLKVFSGRGGATMITEMELGFSGTCPYATLADVFAAAFDLWQAGKKREGFDMFGRIQAFGTITPLSSPDILIARGVFRPETRFRTSEGGGGRGRARGGRHLSIEEIRAALNTYLGPYLNG